VAKTKKGAGVGFLADHEGWHGKALPASDAAMALAELGDPKGDLIVKPQPPRPGSVRQLKSRANSNRRSTRSGRRFATREAYGEALAAVGAVRPNLIALDGEVSNSTFADKFKKAYPDRFIEVFIAEQQLVSAAVGLQALQKIPFASTFAAFFSRAFDQIRMAAISRANINLVGSHAGVSIGEDGASQMALEDLAMMRAVHGSTVLYPSCATTTAHLIAQMATRKASTICGRRERRHRSSTARRRVSRSEAARHCAALRATAPV